MEHTGTEELTIARNTRQQVTQAKKNIRKALNLKYKQTDEIIYDSLTEKTPVQTGLTRGNYIFTIGFEDTSDYRDFGFFGITPAQESAFYGESLDGGSPGAIIPVQPSPVKGLRFGDSSFFTMNVPWIQEVNRRRGQFIQSAVDDAVDEARRRIN